MRLSITARVAFAAILLAIVAGMAPAAFLWQATHDDAIEELRRDTTEQADAFAAIERRAGVPALREAIDRARASDDGSLVAAIVDGAGKRLAGAGPDQVVAPLNVAGFRIERLGANGDWGQREAGFVVRRIGNGWLVSGRQLDDWESAQRTIERALLFSTLLSIALGVGGGLLLSRYVAARVDGVARTADAVAAGDLARRVSVADGEGDAFDRLGRRVNAMLDRIERLMDELRVMTDSVAHDLRSPIARLRARAEAALAAEDAGQREAALAGLVTETDIVTRMLSVLLEISRSETVTRSGFSDVAPAELLEALGELYEPLAEDGDVALTVQIDATCPPLPLHRELLSQALANLIDNALRHAGDGGAIVLRLVAADGAVRFQVEDRGPGIAEADRAEALRRFGRLDPARSKPGAGLGLALVEAVARLHGGALELSDNAPGLIAAIVVPTR